MTAVPASTSSINTKSISNNILVTLNEFYTCTLQQFLIPSIKSQSHVVTRSINIDSIVTNTVEENTTSESNVEEKGRIHKHISKQPAHADMEMKTKTSLRTV